MPRFSGRTCAVDDHERRIGRGFEIFGGRFGEHRGREGAPPLAEFHGVVYVRVHFRVAGIGENRAAAQSARPEFHAALKPADNFSGGEQVGGCGGWIVEPRVANFVGVERALDLGFGRGWAEISVAHATHRQLPAVIEIRSQRCAEANTVVSGCRLDEKLINEAGNENLAVGFGIERNAACEAEISAIRFGDGGAHESEHGWLAGILHGMGDILVAIANFGFRDARRAQQFFDACGRSGVAAKEARGIDAIRIVIRIDEATRD